MQFSIAAMPPPVSLDADDFSDIPIFIQNFNQLSYLRKQVAWLKRAGYRNLIVIDNNSTYPPLLRYYADMMSNSAIRLVSRYETGGKLALWEERILARLGVVGPFVFTSSDIVPDACCPFDIVAHLAVLLRENPQILKAGPALRIDDLPERYRFRHEVDVLQRRFWRAPVAEGVFLARIDTTFALYRPGSAFALRPALRTGWPYLARHEPWYADSPSPSEEELYYASSLPEGRGTWGRLVFPERMRPSYAKLSALPTSTFVHLACGRQIIPGWVNLDRRSDVGADVVFDLDCCAGEGLPFEDGSVDGFLMHHAFAGVADATAMMRELRRAAKPGARFVFRVPFHATAATFDWFAPRWRVKRIKWIVDAGLLEAEGDAALHRRIAQVPAIVHETVIEAWASKSSGSGDSSGLEAITPTIGGSRVDLDSAFDRFGA
jgi:SAM-dependent methyltransferase